tara:strand:+ start:97 stop:1935 length:1839 start_codon:yes stop_codon:yes gene_type:complete
MTTLLKANLRKTDDPLEMFEILLHEYYPTILKATGAQFIDAILADQDTRAQLRGFSKETLEAFKKLQKASEESLTRFKDFDKDEMEGEFPEFMHRDILMGEPDVMVSGKPKKRGKGRSKRRRGEEEVRMERGKTIGESTIKDPKIPKPTKRKWLSQLKRRETEKEFQSRLKRWERRHKTIEPRGKFRSGETGYEEPYRLNNLLKFKNLLEAEKNWDGSKWGQLSKIIDGLKGLITREENRLAGAKKKKTGKYQGEGQASKEKVIQADKNLKRDFEILKKLRTRLQKVNIFDVEGQIVFDKDVEDPIFELLPNPKAIEDLEKATLPNYYFKPLNIKKMTADEKEIVDKKIDEDFKKEVEIDFRRSGVSWDELGVETRSKYLETRKEKDFKQFKKQWLDPNYEEYGVTKRQPLYTNSIKVTSLNAEDMAINKIKKEIHDILTKEQPYTELTGEQKRKTLFEALLYAREQKTGVIVERIKEDREALGKEYNALKLAFKEGKLLDLLARSKVKFSIGPVKAEIPMDEWASLKDNVKNYLNNEFSKVRVIPKDQTLGDKVILKEADIEFLEPKEGFNKSEFKSNFENTFGGRVKIRGAIDAGKRKSREQIMEERGNE